MPHTRLRQSPALCIIGVCGCTDTRIGNYRLMHVRQTAASSQERKHIRPPFFLFMHHHWCISGRESLAGRPSGSLRPPRDPLPLHFPRPPDRHPRCSEGGGAKVHVEGIHRGRSEQFISSTLSTPSTVMGFLFRVLAACGAKDRDCDVRSHSCAVSERCLEPEGAPLRFVPLLC